VANAQTVNDVRRRELDVRESELTRSQRVQQLGVVSRGALIQLDDVTPVEVFEAEELPNGLGIPRRRMLVHRPQDPLSQREPGDQLEGEEQANRRSSCQRLAECQY